MCLLDTQTPPKQCTRSRGCHKECFRISLKPESIDVLGRDKSQILIASVANKTIDLFICYLEFFSFHTFEILFNSFRISNKSDFLTLNIDHNL